MYAVSLGDQKGGKMEPSVPLIVLQKLSDQIVKFGMSFHSSILPRALVFEIPLLMRYRPSFELFFCKNMGEL
jgi:hypothetical protein